MPAVIRPRPPPPQTAYAPRRIAITVQPEVERATIPSRVKLDGRAVPFAGELLEEQAGSILTVAAGGQAVLATLRRPWTYVGAAIDPEGTSSGLSIRLQVITRSMTANIAATVTAVAGTGPFAIGAFALGNRAQLVVTNSGVTAVRVRGVIWGMSEK